MVDTLSDQSRLAEQFDEYLWPLTDATWPLDWRRLANEHRLRARLNEILAHVQATHVAPRVRRLSSANPAVETAITQRIVSGPPDGEPWQLALHEPVPRALRDEWASLSAELRRVSRNSAASPDTR